MCRWKSASRRTRSRSAKCSRTIEAALAGQASTLAEQQYAQALTAEAIKNGLEKTAAAHHLQVVTTQPLDHQGVIASLPDSTQLLAKAFAAKQGDPPQAAPTGEGYAIFQVTGIVVAHAPTFADWKTHVLDDYRHEQLPALLSQKTKDLADKAKAMNDLAKAAKAVGATVKTSDLVGATGQVPDLAQLGQVAPQLFDLIPGAHQRTHQCRSYRRGGEVRWTRTSLRPTRSQRTSTRRGTNSWTESRNEAFTVFMSNMWNDYKKHNRIGFNAKVQQQSPGK